MNEFNCLWIVIILLGAVVCVGLATMPWSKR